jgi:hypothetical protein
MALVDSDSPYHKYENPADKDDFDELFYPVCDYDDREKTLIRNAYRNFKEI